MIQANLFIYLFTILAAMSMAYSSYQRRILPVARPLGSLVLLWVVFSLFRAFDRLNIDISQKCVARNSLSSRRSKHKQYGFFIVMPNNPVVMNDDTVAVDKP